MGKAKINDLYEQAHVVHEIPYESSVVDPSIVSVHKQRVFDRYLFAELIVKECIAQASISNGHGNNQWDKALTFAADNIKKHFGVEE